jgi:transglutaminase-like putative cysteine protease
MNLRLYHQTVYTFSNPVFLEPHMLKFKPRNCSRQRLLTFEMNIHPEPAGRYEFLDENDNQSELVWFNEKHTGLTIETHAKLRHYDVDSFGFLIYPFENNQMPVQYISSDNLNIYLQIIDNQPNVIKYSKYLMKLFGQNTIDFLLSVTHKLHEEIEKTVRHTGPPHPPDRTLQDKKGSCRDLAVLEMEILRNSGFATRFVSGYKFNNEDENHELHAWVEVYIPGPGWTGFDPSTGLMAGNNYIPVSSSFLPADTMPVSGSYRGTANSSMKSTIKIEKT